MLNEDGMRSKPGPNPTARRPGGAGWLAAIVTIMSLAFLPPAFAQTHQHGAAAADTAQAQTEPVAPIAEQASPDPVAAGASPSVSYHNPTIFTLRTGIASGRMVYIGVGGDIDGQVNPTLMVHEGELVQINLINGEGADHDVVIDQSAARS